jgi:hypothetical protein
MNMKPIKDANGLYRDEFSGGVSNADRTAIQTARELKVIRLAKQQEQEELKNDIVSLKKEMSDIKTFLQKIAEKL